MYCPGYRAVANMYIHHCMYEQVSAVHLIKVHLGVFKIANVDLFICVYLIIQQQIIIIILLIKVLTEYVVYFFHLAYYMRL